jgi:hypothetical protein
MLNGNLLTKHISKEIIYVYIHYIIFESTLLYDCFDPENGGSILV